MKTTVTLAQAAHLVATCGKTNTIIFEGEPGIGKSAMLKMLSERLSMDARYFDAALPPDAGDLQIPDFTESPDYFAFKPNKLFHSDKPVLVMLDELGKASRPLQNALLPLLLEHRVGNTKLPDGSIVFGTTNMSSDGVGDMMQAHAKNRVTFVRISKPTADEFIEWGASNDVDPLVLTWVHEYPHALHSYVDMDSKDADSNPYIFNPRKQQDAFVSPRSLEHASHIIKNRAHLTDDMLVAAISGTVGESAARDMLAFVDVADKLTKWDEIMAAPDTARVPDNPIACVMLALSAVARIDKETVTAWVKYMQRLPKEVQFLFASNAMRNKKSSGALVSNREFSVWCTSNAWAL